MAAPLVSLLKGKSKGLKYNPKAQEVIETLKKRFTTTPILHHPDPELQFLVEVDTSELWSELLSIKTAPDTGFGIPLLS